MAARDGVELVPMGSAGAKVARVLDGTVDAYVHAGGQHEWDSAAPVAVALASGFMATRLDGSPLVYNQPDAVVARPRRLPPGARRAPPPAARPTPASAEADRAVTPHSMSQLRTLEAESIHIFREVAAEMQRPCLLFSGGKDSIVMLHIARKAFAPGADPVPGHARGHRPQLRRRSSPTATAGSRSSGCSS